MSRLGAATGPALMGTGEHQKEGRLYLINHVVGQPRSGPSHACPVGPCSSSRPIPCSSPVLPTDPRRMAMTSQRPSSANAPPR
eukprot:scaffold143369_cov19-Tisochrysis_lutea.AAC.1